MSAPTQAESPGLLLPLEALPLPVACFEADEDPRLLTASGAGFRPGVLEALPLATTKPDGIGLGLFVVQTTAENHGGGLRFGRSAALGGAEVRLELPRPPAPLPQALVRADAAAPAGGSP